MIKRILPVLLCFFLWLPAAKADTLYTVGQGVDFGYRFMDADRYNSNRIHLDGNHRLGAHGFSYNFSHNWGTESLTSIGAAYSYKKGVHWVGGGISSSSDEPFTQFNLVDFDAFYAFRVFQRVVRYTDAADGDRIPHYNNLYLGVEWSTDRILLDGYPLPVIRYEYDGPKFYLILGFPMTYLKIYTGRYQNIELKYVPVMNTLLSYNYGFDADNTLSLQFEIDHKQYRMSGGDKHKYFHSQTKYYTEFYWLRLKYKADLPGDAAALSPYVALLLDGKRYYGKNFNDYQAERSTGFGFALGLNLSVKF